MRSRLGLVLAASMAGLSMAFFKAGPALKPVVSCAAARRLGALRMAGADDGVGTDVVCMPSATR